MKEDTASRFGKFLIFIGLLLWVAFFATDHLRSPVFGLFLAGFACLGLGALLVWQHRQPPPQTADRFRSVRRASKRLRGLRARRKEKAAQKKKNTRVQ